MSEKIKVGNAEVDKANYDYFSLLYSKMPKEYVVADLVSKCENYDELYKSYEKTQIELQQKENIIKEVREYLKFLKEHYKELRTSPVEDSYFIDDMLRQMFIQSIENYLVCIEDILDKENK